MVAESMLTDIGGGGYMLTATPSTKTVYDFFVRAPGYGIQTPKDRLDFRDRIDPRGTTQRFHVGLGAAAVPEMCLACVQHMKGGTASLFEILAPALHHAREGVVVTDELAFILEIIGPIFLLDPQLKRAVSKEGRFLQPGEVMDYSHVHPLLEAISREGSQGFYGGDVAAAIERSSIESGGLISREDLSRYRTRIASPLTRSCWSPTFPQWSSSNGGALVAFMLQLCEAVPHHDALNPQEAAASPCDACL